MKKFSFPKKWKSLASVLVGLGLACCGSTVPKVFTNAGVTFTSTSTTINNNFSFNYAYRFPSASGTLGQTIFLEGTTSASALITSTCNYVGTNCVCQFMDGANNILSESTSSQIQYDTTSNILRCQYPSTIANVARVRIRNQSSSQLSDVYAVSTSLTKSQLVGPSLDVNKVRTVSRYACLYNFLQKQGTSALTFDCSHQGSACWSGFTGYDPSGNVMTSGDFCLLQSSVPFFLYSGNYDNNLNLKMSDLLYNAAGTGTECSLQIKQYDCSGASGTAVAQFGLYSEQAGLFQNAISLTPAPGQVASVYGYAAPTMTAFGVTTCPPGTIGKTLWTASTSSALFAPSSNYSTGLTATEVVTYGSSPASNVQVTQVGGGYCNGTACTLPTTTMSNIASFTYSNAGALEFCVVDPAIL